MTFAMPKPVYVLLLFALLLLGSCSTPKQENRLQQVLHSGVLKVGTHYGLTTYYHGAQGPEGFDYELASGFANYLGVKLEVLPYYSMAELFNQLNTRHLDVIAAGITITPQRSQQMRFGPAYQQVSQKLVYKQGKTRPRKLQDLTGSLIIASGSSHATTLRQHKADHPELSWQESDQQDTEELLDMVLDEQLDYTLVDSNILALFRRRHPDLSVGFTIKGDQQLAWALDKDQDDSLLAALIEYFGTIRSNGTLAALEDKYFGHVRKFNYVDTREFIKAVKATLPTYQHWFEQYAQSVDLDWRLLAAMSYQESHWNPKAKSPTGVRGMMMLTLVTAKDLGIRSRLDPEQSIKGGTTYLANLLRRIPDRIQSPDRLWFALAAYNIGMGHLNDARILTERQGGNPDMWIDVKQHLVLLRQKKYYKTTKYGYARGNEAVTYVDNIRRYYDTLIWLDEQQKRAQLQPENNSVTPLVPPTSE